MQLPMHKYPFLICVSFFKITHCGDMGNLVEFITEYGCSMEKAMSFLTKIAQAITFMHNRRFIHCDIRAESVSVYTNGDVS